MTRDELARTRAASCKMIGEKANRLNPPVTVRIYVWSLWRWVFVVEKECKLVADFEGMIDQFRGKTIATRRKLRMQTSW